MNATPAQHGFLWIRQGIDLFRKNPGQFLSLQLAYFSVILLLSGLPKLFHFIWLLLVPTQCLLHMQACRQIAAGRPIWSSELFSPLRHRSLPRLLMLGSLWLLAVSLSLVTVREVLLAIGDKDALQMLMGEGGKAAAGNAASTTAMSAAKLQSIQENLMLASSAGLLVQLPFIVLLWFAPMLITWHQMGIGKALFYSLFTVLRSGRAFIVYALGLFGLLVLVSMLAGLAALLFSIVLGEALAGALTIVAAVLLIFAVFFCSVYCSYQAFFPGTPDTPDTPGVSLHKD